MKYTTKELLEKSTKDMSTASAFMFVMGLVALAASGMVMSALVTTWAAVTMWSMMGLATATGYAPTMGQAFCAMFLLVWVRASPMHKPTTEERKYESLFEFYLRMFMSPLIKAGFGLGIVWVVAKVLSFF